MRCAALPVLVVLSLTAASRCLAVDPAAEALALFREYESRGSQFDPTLADLYSDDALIKTKRVHADGRTQELTFWGDK